ncbi:hypothetical protein [Bartonella sp. B17]
MKVITEKLYSSKKIIDGYDSFAITQLKGKFLLSLNDMQKIRKTFSQFHIKEVTTSHVLGVQKFYCQRVDYHKL